MRDHLWIDPENDPSNPGLLFAKAMVELLQEGHCVDFSSGKPFVMDRDEPFLSNKGPLLSFQTGGTSGKPSQVIHSLENLFYHTKQVYTTKLIKFMIKLWSNIFYI